MPTKAGLEFKTICVNFLASIMNVSQIFSPGELAPSPGKILNPPLHWVSPIHLIRRKLILKYFTCRSATGCS